MIKSDKDYPCCPKGSHGKSHAVHEFRGIDFKVEGRRIYITGCGPKTIIYIPDIFGIDLTQTRKLCDSVAENGYTVVMVDPFLGESWGLDAPIGPDCFKWILNHKAEPVAKFTTEHLLPVLKKLGKTEFGVAGSCYGAWVALRLSLEIPDCKAGIGFHPSYQVESMHGGDIKNVAEKVTAPQILFPAENDPAEIKEDGALIKLLQSKTGGKSETHTFTTEVHGFMNRGDLNNPATKKAHDEVLRLTGEFLKKNF